MRAQTTLGREDPSKARRRSVSREIEGQTRGLRRQIPLIRFDAGTEWSCGLASVLCHALRLREVLRSLRTRVWVQARLLGEAA